jgi:hypothetical protein
MNTQTLIEKITKAIAFVYKSDGTVPGLTIAMLPHNGSFYVSVVRWVAGEKEVACSNSHSSLNEALIGLSGKFLLASMAPVNPLDELSEFLANEPISVEESELEIVALAN